jgi:cell division septation protein DedD
MARKRSKSKKKPKKKYLVEMTSFSVLIWGFCLFFLLTWIFVLGILVGRGFIPGGESAIFELKAQIAKLQEIVGNNKAVAKRSQKKSDRNPELAFYERLSSKKVEAKSRWQSEKDIEVPKKKGALDTRKVPPPNRLEGINARQEIKPKSTPMGKAPTTQKAKEKRGSSQSLQILSETSIPEIRYTVQLASLGSRDKAERLINDLVDRGYPAYYYEAVVKGKTYFRVRCGEFYTNREAGRFAEKLTKDMGIKGFVSRFEKKLP